jgi:hypothetical protein
MEPESSLPCSQDPATNSDPEADVSSTHPPTIFPKDPLQYYLPTSCEWSHSLKFSIQNFVRIFHLPPCATCPYYLILLDLSTKKYLSKSTYYGASLIMQFSPTPCHFIPLRSKYSLQHPVLKCPECVFFASPDMEGTCELGVAGSRQAVIFQLVGWAGANISP